MRAGPVVSPVEKLARNVGPNGPRMLAEIIEQRDATPTGQKTGAVGADYQWFGRALGITEDEAKTIIWAAADLGILTLTNHPMSRRVRQKITLLPPYDVKQRPQRRDDHIPRVRQGSADGRLLAAVEAPMTVAEIARALSVSTQAVGPRLRRLADEGRVAIVNPSEAGPKTPTRYVVV